MAMGISVKHLSVSRGMLKTCCNNYKHEINNPEMNKYFQRYFFSFCIHGKTEGKLLSNYH